MASSLHSVSIFILFLVISSSFFTTEARPLNASKDLISIDKAIQKVFDGSNIKTMETGGLSSEGRMHYSIGTPIPGKFKNSIAANGLYVKVVRVGGLGSGGKQFLQIENSGPSPGEGH